jgi:uncharacterized protein YgfB (UPF0149 family)
MVMALKCFKSAGKRQGSWLSLPITRLSAMAAIAESVGLVFLVMGLLISCDPFYLELISLRCHFILLVVLMKATIDLPDYYEINQVLSGTTLKLHPSQVHGLICGLLCGSQHGSSVWEELVTGEKKPGKAHKTLQALYDASAKQLDEFLFEFQLLLPKNDDSLLEKAEALTLWVQGFLTGLKLAQIQIENREPSETTEAINDMIEIAKMNYEEVIASEEDEAAYTELVEYIRMAVILIYQDLHEVDTSKKVADKSNHLH